MLLPVLLTLGPALVSAVTLDCKHLRVDGQSFDLSELGGPHAVHQIESEPPSISNMTFTIDVCDTLKRTKGVPKEDECLSGTRGECRILRIAVLRLLGFWLKGLPLALAMGLLKTLEERGRHARNMSEPIC